jgi:hypothetical protein
MLRKPRQRRAALLGSFEVADLEDAPGGLVDQEAQLVAATQVTQGALGLRRRPA